MSGMRRHYRSAEAPKLRAKGASVDEIYQDTLSIMDTIPDISATDALTVALEGAKRFTEHVRSTAYVSHQESIQRKAEVIQ